MKVQYAKVSNILDMLFATYGTSAELIFFDEDGDVIWKGYLSDCPFKVWRRELVGFKLGNVLIRHQFTVK